MSLQNHPTLLRAFFRDDARSYERRGGDKNLVSGTSQSLLFDVTKGHGTKTETQGLLFCLCCPSSSSSRVALRAGQI